MNSAIANSVYWDLLFFDSNGNPIGSGEFNYDLHTTQSVKFYNPATYPVFSSLTVNTALDFFSVRLLNQDWSLTDQPGQTTWWNADAITKTQQQAIHRGTPYLSNQWFFGDQYFGIRQFVMYSSEATGQQQWSYTATPQAGGPTYSSGTWQAIARGSFEQISEGLEVGATIPVHGADTFTSDLKVSGLHHTLDDVLIVDPNTTLSYDAQLGAGNNRAKLGKGNDRITALSGIDILESGEGNDTIHAGGGNDFIDGNAQNDWLHGAAGQDLVRGGAGADFLLGGKGADVLIGGTGADTFEYQHLNELGDILPDFEIGIDKIRISQSLLKKIASIKFATGENPFADQFPYDSAIQLKLTNGCQKILAFVQAPLSLSDWQKTFEVYEPIANLTRALPAYLF
ncbi:MAG: hypothetical protein Kow00121_15810 [Elainellaceae cyanobacterium]